MKIKTIISAISSHIPTTNIVVFHSFPDYTDNTYAICKHMAACGLDKKYRFVWLVNEKDNENNIKTRIHNDGIKSQVFYRLSLPAFWSFIRARYVFITHGLYDDIILNQHDDKIINLWHGMPLKKLGASEERGLPCSYNTNITFSSGKLFQPIMAEAFNLPIDRVLPIGQPRCDLLFKDFSFINELGIDRGNYRNVGIWMPTYRQSIVGDIRVDGTYEEGRISILNEKQLVELDNHLRDNEDYLIIKIHPMDVMIKHEFPKFHNILILKPNDLKCQLYSLLGACDYLLTDYSSVFIDFEITNKPMAFVMDDIVEYSNSRGLYFNNLSEILPGPIISDIDELYGFIDSPYITKTSVRYNDYKDSNASSRILRQLQII